FRRPSSQTALDGRPGGARCTSGRRVHTRRPLHGVEGTKLPEPHQLHVPPVAMPDLDRHGLASSQTAETPRDVAVRRRDANHDHPRRTTLQREIIPPQIHDHHPPRPPLDAPLVVTVSVPRAAIRPTPARPPFHPLGPRPPPPVVLDPDPHVVAPPQRRDRVRPAPVVPTRVSIVVDRVGPPAPSASLAHVDPVPTRIHAPDLAVDRLLAPPHPSGPSRRPGDRGARRRDAQ